VFASVRDRECLAACLFVALVLLVGGERRLAEAHFNARTSVVGLENDDSLDGDEIRVRLLVLNDDRPPTVFTQLDVLQPTCRVDRPARPCRDVVGPAAPRAPPLAGS
jgi:hypothetical protein